jgi:AcrR family transcriptional regulator
MTPSRQSGSRRYDASGRQAQARENRARVLAAASRLFVAHGYASTTVAQVAAAAGVSAPTVFAHFTSKANLLKAAVDLAIVGDDEQAPLHQRPAMRQVHEAATAEEVLRRFAAASAGVAARAFGLVAALRAAADADPEIAELARDLDQQRLTGIGIVASTVADRLGLGDDPAAFERVRDSIWTAYSPEVYDLLVVRRGWSPTAYQAWIVHAALGSSPPPPR